MSDQPKSEPSIYERSNIVRTCRWLFSRRGGRRMLIVLAWTVTIVGLWYGEENWRGRRAWNKYRETTEARGESLNFATFIPKAVVDDQNFAGTPFLKSFFLRPEGAILTNDLYARGVNHIASEGGNWKDRGRRHFEDLAAWQMVFDALQKGDLKRTQQFRSEQSDLTVRAMAAPDVLGGMQPDVAVFAELRAASTREFSRFPLVYDLENPWGILLPHLARMKGICERLKLQACSELALGQTDKALEDVKLALAVTDSSKSEPLVISFLVRAACLQIAVQPVWEGLAEHRWNDAQLQELQARFLSYDFPDDMDMPLKAERATGVLTVDLVKKKGLPFFFNVASPNGNRGTFNPVVYLIGRVIPSGWYDWEKLNYGTLFDALRKGVVDRDSKTVSPQIVAANAAELERQIYRGPLRFGDNEVDWLIGNPKSGEVVKRILQHRIIATMLLPSLSNIPNKAAKPQVAADQAALACALERYRLANGQFPETLDALKPQLMSRLPNDVITGQPYKYRRADDGRFILYSVGWNEKDDGGVPGKTLFDDQQGDWVWEYPVK